MWEHRCIGEILSLNTTLRNKVLNSANLFLGLSQRGRDDVNMLLNSGNTNWVGDMARMMM